MTEAPQEDAPALDEVPEDADAFVGEDVEPEHDLDVETLESP